MVLLLFSIFLVSSLFKNTIAANDTYYNPDGSQSGTANFKACFPSDPFTHCCDNQQTCLSNGLRLVLVWSPLNNI